MLDHKHGQVAGAAAPTLEDAIILAARTHCGQIYPTATGEPFILHPLRLLMRAGSDLERMVAVLHDVIEDTNHTLGDLRRLGYTDEVVAALDCLTRRPGEPYMAYIERVATNPTARQVKLADLSDNLANNLSLEPTDETLQRIAQYQAAQDRLLAVDRPGMAPCTA